MRFEIVDDLGHRFVQIDREQTQVTFSRGLVASGPAVETHDYGTVEAAVAAEQEVAARLNGLGYEDISHDEDTLVIPMEWRRSFEQRRGGLRGVVVAVDPDAPEKLAEILAESEQAAGELIYESADPEIASCPARIQCRERRPRLFRDGLSEVPAPPVRRHLDRTTRACVRRDGRCRNGRARC